jgi:hypothetical protein
MSSKKVVKEEPKLEEVSKDVPTIVEETVVEKVVEKTIKKKTPEEKLLGFYAGLQIGEGFTAERASKVTGINAEDIVQMWKRLFDEKRVPSKHLIRF